MWNAERGTEGRAPVPRSTFGVRRLGGAERRAGSPATSLQGGGPGAGGDPGVDWGGVPRPRRVRAVAVRLYERFVALLRERSGGVRVETGEFGAMMDVELVNDGPVTMILEK